MLPGSWYHSVLEDKKLSPSGLCHKLSYIPRIGLSHLPVLHLNSYPKPLTLLSDRDLQKAVTLEEQLDTDQTRPTSVSASINKSIRWTLCHAVSQVLSHWAICQHKPFPVTTTLETLTGNLRAWCWGFLSCPPHPQLSCPRRELIRDLAREPEEHETHLLPYYTGHTEQ